MMMTPSNTNAAAHNLSVINIALPLSKSQLSEISPLFKVLSFLLCYKGKKVECFKNANHLIYKKIVYPFPYLLKFRGTIDKSDDSIQVLIIFLENERNLFLFCFTGKIQNRKNEIRIFNTCA